MSGFSSWQSYWSFEHAVRRNRRYVRSTECEEFLQSVRQTTPSRKATLKKGAIFWRAQLGHEWRRVKNDDDEVEAPVPYPRERMKPLRDRASEGRANPKGIPCLYLATTKEAAMSEVRPWIGSKISVGKFKITRNIEIIECSYDHARANHFYLEEPSTEKVESSVWAHIDQAFAEPVTRSDDTAEYAATQIIAELFKDAGFGGVAYKSNFGQHGYNIALFDIDIAELVKCYLYRVDGIDMKFSPEGN